MVDGRHDLAVGDQLLDLEGVLLAIGELDPFQEDQHRVAELIICHRRGLDGVGGDVVQVLGVSSGNGVSAGASASASRT
jgi:hypothetical protein